MAEDYTNDLVQCLLCDPPQYFIYINAYHLKWVHGITCADYQDEFPGEPMQSTDYIEERASQIRGIPKGPQSAESNDLRSIAMRKWWETPEGLEYKKRVHLNWRNGI